MENSIKVKQKSIKLNVILHVFTTLAGLVFPLITFPYASRILGPENLGKISFANSFVAYFILIASLGIPAHAVRICSKVRDDKEKLSQTVHELLIINIIFTVISYLILAACIIFINEINVRKELILVVSTSIILNTVGITWLYTALEEYVYISIRSLVASSLYLVLIFVFIKKADDYIIYAMLSVLVSAGAGIMNIFHSRKFISFKRAKKYSFKAHLKPIFYLSLISAFVAIYTNLDRVLLGLLLNDYSVGIYDMSSKFYTILKTVIISFSAVLLPRISYYFSQNAHGDIERLVKKAVNGVLILAIPAIIFFGVYSEQVILIFGGRVFYDSIVPLKILLPALLFCTLSNISGNQILVGANKEKFLIISTFCGALFSIVFNLIFIPRMGVLAPAVAALITEFIILTVQLIFLKDYLKVILKSIHVPKLLILAVVTFDISFLFTFCPLSGLMTFILALVSVGIAFVLILLIYKDEIILELFKSAGKIIKRKNNTLD